MMNPFLANTHESLTALFADAGPRPFRFLPPWLANQGAESNTDHAAKWETSNMMFFYPGLVDLSALGDGPLAPDMKAPDGIGGLDPRKHASVEVGRRNVELAAQAIGRKAKGLLEGLPAGPDSSRPRAISPGHWWMI